MKFWWVNQNQTYKHEVEGGYMWSPKTRADGAHNEFYVNMTKVKPGDIIFLRARKVEQFFKELAPFITSPYIIVAHGEYADGFKIFHNFIRKSARENLTPADKCNIGLNGNRWENLLLKSIKHNNSLNATGKEDLMITP